MNEDDVSNSFEPKNIYTLFYCGAPVGHNRRFFHFHAPQAGELNQDNLQCEVGRRLQAVCHRCRCLRAAGLVFCRKFESFNFLDLEFTSRNSKYCLGGAGGSPDLFPAQCSRNILMSF